MTRPIERLTPVEVLALAVHVERANARRFRAFACAFRGYDDAVAARFEALANEEDHHEALLVARFQERFGGDIPRVDEADVAGVIESVDLDDGEHHLFDSLKPERVLELTLRTEQEAQEFYRRAAACAAEPGLVRLFQELAAMEGEHVAWVLRQGQPKRNGEPT